MTRMTPALGGAALLAALVAFTGCTSKSHGPARALWSADANAVDNPWPSDRLRAGGLAKTPPGYFAQVLPAGTQFDVPRQFLDTAAAAIASNGGFSVYAPIVVKLSHEVDPASLAGVHVYPAGGGTDAAVDITWTGALDALLLTPRAPLAQKTEYVLAIASPSIQPSPEFTAALASDPALATLAAAAVAQGAAATAADLDLVVSFTTAPVADDLQKLQARIDLTLGSALLPDLSSAAPIANYPVGVFAAGTPEFAAIFSQASANTTGIAAIAQGTWQAFDFRDANDLFDRALLDGTSLTPATTTVDFRLCIPNGTPPAGGWPIVITSHGLTSDSDEAVARCSSFAKAGIAVVGQTATDHGFRGSVLTFFDFRRILAVRDEFRQSAGEILQMQRLLANAKANAIAPFDTLDTANPHYWGNSLGALIGGSAIATSSHFQSSGLSVPGGRLTRLFEGNAGYGLLTIFANQIGVPPESPEFPDYLVAFRILGQASVDQADPGALAPSTPPTRKVLLQESLGDATILNVASEDLRVAFGFATETVAIDPFTGPGAMWIWDKAQFPNLPADTDPHNLYWVLPPMRHQMETWILSNGMDLANPPN